MLGDRGRRARVAVDEWVHRLGDSMVGGRDASDLLCVGVSLNQVVSSDQPSAGSSCMAIVESEGSGLEISWVPPAGECR